MRDILGAWLSVLCVLHCSLPILLLSFGASFGLHEFLESIHDEWLHAALITPIVFILGISLPKAYAAHRNALPIYLAVLGVVTLTMAVIGGHHFETLLTVIGSAFVISAHLINRKSLRGHVQAVIG